MEKIASFKKDHDNLTTGLYGSGTLHGVTTWDLRFKKPNGGDYISPKALHTVEHMLATALRNSTKKDEIIYFGPMGCRTGFYLLTVNLGFAETLAVIKESCESSLSYAEIPGNKREECGNYLEHDFDGAKEEIKNYLEILKKYD